MEEEPQTNTDTDFEPENGSAPNEPIENAPRLKKSYQWIIGIAVFIILAGGGFAAYKYRHPVQTGSQVGQRQIIDNIKDQPIKKRITGWNTYRNEVLGIEFQYPAEWGEPRLEPVEYVTDLSAVLEKYKNLGEDNAYNTSMEMRFAADNAPRLKFLSQLYQGEHYKNVQTYGMGYIDNIPALKATGNICDYKIHFDHRPIWRNTLEEIFSECDQRVKTYLIKDIEHFDEIKYTYTLMYAGAIKLHNGFFDTVLITQNDGMILQVANNNLTLDELINWKWKGNETYSYKNRKNTFGQFVDSMIAFTPPPSEPLVFEKKINENPNYTRIREYYFHLANGHVESAYQFRDKNALAIGDLNREYGRVYKLKLATINTLSNGQYEVFFNLQDHNEKPTQAREVLVITKEGKIKIGLSERISETISYQGNKAAYIALRGDNNYIILKDGEKEFIADEAPYSYDNPRNTLGSVRYFSDIGTSPLQRYIVYTAGGWEWYDKLVYDTKTRARKAELSFAEFTAFNNDETFFIACGTGYGSPSVAQIFRLPEFTVQYDLLKQDIAKNYQSLSCKLNGDNALFELSEKYNYTNNKSEPNAKLTVEYELKTGEIRLVK